MQLLLPVMLQTNQTFDAFVEQGQNVSLLINEIKNGVVNDDFIACFVSGDEESGKTHFLTACCNFAESQGKSSILLPMEQLVQTDPEFIEGLEHMDVICVDNVDQVAGNSAWQTALFNLYNQLVTSNACIIFSANNIATELGIELPDLVSRLQWGQSFQLHHLDEEQKASALINHAHLMGFELGPEAANFMINRLPRNMSILMSSLKVVAKTSVEQQRKVTVPFVKECLNI